MKIRIQLTEPMLGTVPKDKEIYRTYIESKAPVNGEDEAWNIEEIEEKGWTGFMKDENGLFIYDYMIRGFLKNAGNVLKENLKIKNLKSKIDDRVFIFPRKIHFGKMEPDGTLERPLRAITMKGPRVFLSRSDYINAGSEVNVEIKILENKEITKETILRLLDYGQLCGLGQWRNGSYGRFVYENIGE